MSDTRLERQAERWMASMMKLWEPLEHKPNTAAEMCALGLEHGLEHEWWPGGRLDLVRAATGRSVPVRAAFVTIAVREWPADFLNGENFWLLPCQLTWAWSGIELSNDGLPEGVGINDLPQPRIERREPPGEGGSRTTDPQRRRGGVRVANATA